jgi:hypothetical protein
VLALLSLGAALAAATLIGNGPIGGGPGGSGPDGLGAFAALREPGVGAGVGAGRDGEVELPDRREAPGEPLVCRPNDCAAWAIELREHTTVLPIADTLVEVGEEHVRGRDASSGEPRWTRDLDHVLGNRASGAVLARPAGDALLLHTRGELAVMDPTDGALVWSIDLGPRWVDRTGRAGDIILVTTNDRLHGRSRPLPATVVAFDAGDGTVLWEQPVLDALRPPDVPPASDTAFVPGGDAARPDHRQRLQAPQDVLVVALGPGMLGGIEVTTGEILWQHAAVTGWVIGDRVALLETDGHTVVLDATTGETLTDLGDDVVRLTPVGPLLVVTTGDDRSSVVDGAGRVTDRRDGPPLGWTETSTDVFIAWNDDDWALIVRYERAGEPAHSRRLPGRIGSWGGELTLGAHAGSDLVRAIGVDGRTTVAVRTDAPTEPPPIPSIGPSGALLSLIGRTIVAADHGGVTVRAPGGSVRVDAGREVIALAADGTVVVRGDGALLGIDGDRLGPVDRPETTDRS